MAHMCAIRKLTGASPSMWGLAPVLILAVRLVVR